MTWALIQFSYVQNYMPIGAVIMLLHDSSDLPVSIMKLVVDITSTKVQITAVVINLLVWIYTRLWIFPFFVIHRLLEECFYQTVPGVNYSVINMMLAFLIGLICLHIFWTYLIFKAIYRKLSKKNPGEYIAVKGSAIKVD